MTALARLTCAALAAVAGTGIAHAASVRVSVTDATGRPLPFSVVTLSSAEKHAVVTPLSGIEVSQAKRQFTPRVTVVTVGTAVQFPNFDTVRHHVYSFSPVKPFELKLYSGMPGAPVVFDKPGIATLGCNIHDRMSAWIVVVDTPWYASSAADGVATLANVPAGTYQMRVWHAGLSVDTTPVVTTITVGSGELALDSQLAVTVNPLGGGQ